MDDEAFLARLTAIGTASDCNTGGADEKFQVKDSAKPMTDAPWPTVHDSAQIIRDPYRTQTAAFRATTAIATASARRSAGVDGRRKATAADRHAQLEADISQPARLSC